MMSTTLMRKKEYLGKMGRGLAIIYDNDIF